MSSNDAFLSPDTAVESATQQTYITETLPNDVLLGRGSHLVKYEGNIEFRRLIQERKREYVLAARHSHKDHIAREIINKVSSTNGRFLRKVEDPNEMKRFDVPSHLTSVWFQVDTDTIVEKIKQAFRDSCKDGTPTDQHQRNSRTPCVHGAVAYHSSIAWNIRGTAGRNKLDMDSDSTVAISLQQVEKSDNQNTKTSPSISTDHSTSQQNLTPAFPHQDYQESLIKQQVLQYQQNQRLLLEHLNSQQAKSASTSEAIEMNSAMPIGFASLQGRYTNNPFYQDAVRQMVQKHLQAKSLQSQIHSELSGRTHPPTRQQIQSNTTTSVIPEHSQYLRRTNGDIASLSMVEQEQTDVILSLHRNQLEQTQFRHDLSKLIDTRNALLALQRNSSILPSLPGYSTFSRGQSLPNDHISNLDVSGLLSGSASLINLSQESCAERASSSMISPYIQYKLNANIFSSTDLVYDSLLGTSADAVKAECDNTSRRSNKTNCHPDDDDESVARKKMRAIE